MNRHQHESYFSLTDFSSWLRSRSYSSVFVLCDVNTARYCFPLFQQAVDTPLKLITIPDGEKGKSLESCQMVWQFLTDNFADRSSVLINLGGGMVTDIGGFAAATYKRGISFVNIPTTLLALIDASAGGKTGINFLNFKNQIGVFSEPVALVIDTVFLTTLPQRELRSAYAEIIKHYLIADKAAFQLLSSLDSESFFTQQETITHNIAIKRKFTDADPLEKSIRKALNFGHTIGHALESLLMDTAHPLLHGEAIAIGLLAESFISYKMNLLSMEELKEIEIVMSRYFRLSVKDNFSVAECMELMRQDKKNKDGEIKFTLLQGIGNYSIDQSVEDSIIAEAIRHSLAITS